MRRAVQGVLVPALLVLACACSTAMADHSRTELVSVGPGGANISSVSTVVGNLVSRDGTKAFFQSADQVVAEDSDGLCERGYGGPGGSPLPPEPCQDVYERDLRTKTTALVSTGPAGASGDYDAELEATTPDGTHVYFVTREPLVPEDTDSGCDNYLDVPPSNPTACEDVYERTGGTTRLVSQGTGSVDGPFDVEFNGVSDDGSRVFFTTAEQLVPADSDTHRDVYARSDGTTILVSTGSTDGGFHAASADGSKVVFITNDSLVAQDTDNCPYPAQLPQPCPDLYLRDLDLGTTELVSGGLDQNSFTLLSVRATRDADRIFFVTDRALVAEDGDLPCNDYAECWDVYEYSGGRTKLISTGPKQTGNGTMPPRGTTDDAFLDGISDDGARVFFHTQEQLVDADTDTARDAYMREGDTTTLFSGPAGGDPRPAGYFAGASADGSRVFVASYDRWSADDTDDEFDIYEAAGAAFERLTLGPLGGNGPDSAFADAYSEDGRRYFFETTEELTADDVNPGQDVYERFAGTTTLISKGPTGASAQSARGEQWGVADEGRRFFFWASGRLTPDDTDSSNDIYVSIANAAPTCDTVVAHPRRLLPANKRFRTVVLSGAGDPDGDPVALEVTRVTQDEPVGRVPDARLAQPTRAVRLRAEHHRKGDGRVYRIAFRASDDHGGECRGVAKVAVPRGPRPAVDSAPPSFLSLGL